MVANPYHNLNDKELMHKYQNGDYMAFEVLYYRHKDKVYSYFKRKLYHDDDIEDLFQKTFIKLHKSRDLYSDKYDLLPWLYTISKSVYLDFKKRKRIDFVELNEANIVIQGEKRNKVLHLESEKSLSQKERDALNQRYYHDKDFLEIARTLKVSESNVRKIISRGIKKLKNKYKEKAHGS